MTSLYPLRFEPRFRRYIWGGRRLEKLLRKQIGEGNDYAESWEVVDHGHDQSVVESGHLEGATLADVREHYGEQLFGRHAPQARFPLLYKYLDAQQNLSVQVHPDDDYAARLDPPDYGKSEAWVVIHAEPDSLIYAGLKRGIDRQAFERELRRGVPHLCLNAFRPEPGDCFYIPAGIIHALGAGLVIAEIQQSSDTTYRVYDWDRLGPAGQPRPLHIERALEVISFHHGPVVAQQPQQTNHPHVERLVACEKFVLDRWRIRGTHALGGDQRFHIISVLEGTILLEHDPAGRPLERGDTALIPASVHASLRAAESAVLLDMYLP
jgi:mannose-6-phosphate isomerase